MMKPALITERFNMTIWLRCLLIAALAELAPGFPQGNQAPFSITISAAKNVFKAGSEVKIRLVFKNTSDHEVPYGRGLGIGVEPQGELFSDVEVRDAKGDLAPETKYGLLIRGNAGSSASPATREKSAGTQAASGPPEPLPIIRMSVVGYMLKAGESREEDIDITKLYDLSQPGQYTISASRLPLESATDPNGRVVKSNALVITITK